MVDNTASRYNDESKKDSEKQKSKTKFKSADSEFEFGCMTFVSRSGLEPMLYYQRYDYRFLSCAEKGGVFVVRGNATEIVHRRQWN